MRTMHLFAGIGGGLLSDLILGHTPVIAVEWDKYACKVLRQKISEGWFPELQLYEGDVKLFDPSEYSGRVDLIHAGFPCTDISVAGNQAGVGEETRSGLYREAIRITSVVRPRYIFLENVAAITSAGLGTVIGDLSKIGYDAEWLCLRASDCGANHLRDRWWLLGYPIGTGLQRREIARDNGKIWTESKYEFSTGRCRGNSWYETEPDVGRVANGVSNRMGKLKGLGNAQVPLQAAVAFKLLIDMHEGVL